MNVVDSSGWLEYLADGPAASFFASAIERPAQLIVPTLTLFEVFKRVRQQRDESAALSAVALMRQGRVVDLTETLAVAAANLSIEHRLPLADSIIYATARAHDATLWTMDADFAQLAHVRYRRRA
jgi:predicted nucleic acid-binding protein